MADKKGQTIIIKRVKKGGHAAAHGGAWKVAFADFMTAMMTFFLVMWLLGSDEEVKQSVTTYFNNPSSPWRIDVADKAIPLGDRTADGESVINGQEGLTPDDLIKQPVQPYNISQGDTGGDDQSMSEEQVKTGRVPSADLNIELLRFTIPEDSLFIAGTQNFTDDAKRQLEQLSKMVRTHKGNVVIRGFTSPAPEVLGDQDPYEFSLSRTVHVMKYLTGNRLIDEERVKTEVAREKRADLRMIEFTFSQE